jgi:SAM-dependent methyltransferase
VRRVSVPSSVVVSVGAGDSLLIADLVAHGYTDLIAVDISAEALERLVERLGPLVLTTIVADVRRLALPRPVDVWHDRAVFHFLTETDDRRDYVARATEAVRPGGHVVIATFALDGPEQCSGLPVARYDADLLAAEFAPAFELTESSTDTHTTPWGSTQSFQHAVLRRV